MSRAHCSISAGLTNIVKPVRPPTESCATIARVAADHKSRWMVAKAAMRLRAQIIVDISADNYVEAAEHQRFFERLLADIKANYPGAELLIRERRERRTDQISLESQVVRRMPVSRLPVRQR